MFYRKIILSAAMLVLVLATTTATFATGSNNSFPADKRTTKQQKVQISEPLNLAVLIQDDLISQVGNELGVTSDFIRSLPSGSRVMVGYITTGTLQVRQSFTTDLDQAAHSLRIPRSSTSASSWP